MITREAIRRVVEEYSPEVFGTRYGLRVDAVSVATGAPSAAGVSHVSLVVSAVHPRTALALEMFIIATVADPSQIPTVIDAALTRRLFERQMSARRQRFQLARTLWASIRMPTFRYAWDGFARGVPSRSVTGPSPTAERLRVRVP